MPYTFCAYTLLRRRCFLWKKELYQKQKFRLSRQIGSSMQVTVRHKREKRIKGTKGAEYKNMIRILMHAP